MHEARKQRLTDFVAWASEHITGDEKGEAQIFMDRLFQAFGQKGCLDVGGHPEFRIRKAQKDGGGTSFADYVWKPKVLIEMKKRGEDLGRHYRQAFDYWTRLVPGRPRYVVLCNFDAFWVYDFEIQMDVPIDQVTLKELPDRWGPLAFLFPTGERPTFGNDHEAVTREAADRLALCFNQLIWRGVDRPTAQRFILQILVALFAEDIGLLDTYFVANLLEDCKTPSDCYDLIGNLFVEMNTPGRTAGGRFKGVDYFDGGLFAEPARLELEHGEILQLRAAAKADWSKVRPEIFGTLFEHSLGKEERHAFGAHFTSHADIMKIVGPTIVDPWREQIEEAKTITRLEQLHHRMQGYTVLDPACGSGNFLYLAYRELKRLEARIFEQVAKISTAQDKSQKRFGFVTARQFYGMDINPFAVELGKVTMMIARKLAIDELHVNEQPLPLDNLDGNFIVGDALIDDDGNRVQWPKADVIIGNPPFLGAKRLKPERGPDYVNAVRKAYPDIPGMADYCVYWFRKAHNQLPDCTADDPVAGRAGLVGTQNIRNNKSRVGGLDHIVATGTIIEAVDNQPWSGEANVHVSITNWVKTEDAKLLPVRRRLWFKVEPSKGSKGTRKRGEGPAAKAYELNYRECSHIDSSLSDQTDVSGAEVLLCNREPQRVFQGITPGHAGFVLSVSEREEMIRKDRTSTGVIHPYLIGRELVNRVGTPERFLIDFEQRSILEAQRFAGAFQQVESTVLPDRLDKAEKGKDSSGRMRSHHKGFLERWWQLSWGRADMLAVFHSLHGRTVACSRTQRIPFIFTFISTSIRPGDKLQVFAYDDDYSFGVLQGRPHCEWYRRRAARLKNEVDYNYSSESVFGTFPWPQSPSVAQMNAVAAGGRAMRRVRDGALGKIKGGLRALYRTLELPGKNPLRDAHAALDEAVLNAYGFDPKADLLAQLLTLNLDVAARIKADDPVTAPGIPPAYPCPEELITEDCISP